MYVGVDESVVVGEGTGEDARLSFTRRIECINRRRDRLVGTWPIAIDTIDSVLDLMN